MIEVLVAMALISVISLVLMGALAPWMHFKQKLDTQRRLQDIRQGLISLYQAKAMAIEQNPAAQLDSFVSSTITNGRCASQASAFAADSNFFSESPQQISVDGFSKPWCIWVTAPIQSTRDGVTLWYRNIIVLSTGDDGVVDKATVVKPDGSLTTGGDDFGIVVSGEEIQAAKLTETLRRMNKVAQMYETYFTTRYLANASRDITTYYFSSTYDAQGAVGSTNGTWAPVSTALANIGVGPTDSVTAWEANNAIEMGNATESQNSITVRSPATSGTGVLPYTALLRANVPSPSGQPTYALQVVVGNY